ncbi:MAG: hypothetical protein ACI4G0_06970 [Ruminococcus sp.]
MANNDDFSVQIDPNCTEEFDLSVVTYNENVFKFNFANLITESDKEIVSVKRIATLPADFMHSFLSQLIQTLAEYEKEFKNGKGLDLSN